jgi:hypothetical protein
MKLTGSDDFMWPDRVGRPVTKRTDATHAAILVAAHWRCQSHQAFWYPASGIKLAAMYSSANNQVFSNAASLRIRQSPALATRLLQLPYLAIASITLELGWAGSKVESSSSAGNSSQAVQACHVDLPEL